MKPVVLTYHNFGEYMAGVGEFESNTYVPKSAIMVYLGGSISDYAREYIIRQLKHQWHCVVFLIPETNLVSPSLYHQIKFQFTILDIYDICALWYEGALHHDGLFQLGYQLCANIEGDVELPLILGADIDYAAFDYIHELATHNYVKLHTILDNFINDLDKEISSLYWREGGE